MIARTELLRAQPQPIFRENTRVPCQTCGHTVFIEQLRAPRTYGRQDCADRELCELCETSRTL